MFNVVVNDELRFAHYQFNRATGLKGKRVSMTAMTTVDGSKSNDTRY